MAIQVNLDRSSRKYLRMCSRLKAWPHQPFDGIESLLNDVEHQVHDCVESGVSKGYVMLDLFVCTCFGNSGIRYTCRHLDLSTQFWLAMKDYLISEEARKLDSLLGRLLSDEAIVEASLVGEAITQSYLDHNVLLFNLQQKARDISNRFKSYIFRFYMAEIDGVWYVDRITKREVKLITVPSGGCTSIIQDDLNDNGDLEILAFPEVELMITDCKDHLGTITAPSDGECKWGGSLDDLINEQYAVCNQERELQTNTKTKRRSQKGIGDD